MLVVVIPVPAAIVRVPKFVTRELEPVDAAKLILSKGLLFVTITLSVFAPAVVIPVPPDINTVSPSFIV